MTPSECPACGADLVATADQPPWCPECEWNLAERNYPGRHRPPSRAARRARAVAFEVNRRLLGELSDTLPTRPRAGRAETIITGAALLLLVVDLALVFGGGYFLVTGSFLVQVPALIAVLIGIECRPRVPRLGRDTPVLTREDLPNLYAALDVACAALGAPTVDAVLIDDEYNAWCVRVGLRRRTVLGLGLPLWGALGADGRMALLGHELGHLVNGDPTRTVVTQPALLTFERLATIFDPRGIFVGRRTGLEPLAFVLLAPFHFFFRGVGHALLRVALRDHQRAEIYADALAVRLGGSAGAEQLMRSLLFDRPVLAAVQRRASAGRVDPADWRTAAVVAIEGQRPRTRTAEQVSLRMDASAYAGHPPSGLRLRLVREWPAKAAIVDAPAGRLAAADDELRTHYASVGRHLSRLPSPA